MACTRPNQWARPPTTSNCRSNCLDLKNDIDGHALGETGRDEMLDCVRQLIVELVVDDVNCRHDRIRHDAGIEVEQPVRSCDSREAKHVSNNPEVENERDWSVREQVLEIKLARALMVLAGERNNLRLAAKAGNALLEELGAAREELDTLHDEMEAVQLERDGEKHETQRLEDQHSALETELQCYDVSYGSYASMEEQNALNQSQQIQQQQRPSLTLRSNMSKTDSCERCTSRELDVTQLEQRFDELKRRCLELELVREREQQRQQELTDEVVLLRQQSKDHVREMARVQQELEVLTLQAERKTEEVESMQNVRDTLRRTTRRLEAKNEDLQARLAARDELVKQLEKGKTRAATQLQVAENRTTTAEAETKRATKTLEQLQEQLEHALQGQNGSNEMDVRPCEKEIADMEQLLQDALKEVASLRLENRLLRRQHLSEAQVAGSRMRSRRRKTLCMESPAMTAAEVLALDSHEPTRGGDTWSSKSKTVTECDLDSNISTESELLPLEIDAIAPLVEPVQDLSPDTNKRRQVALHVSWVKHQRHLEAGERAIATPLPLHEEQVKFLSVLSDGVIQVSAKQSSATLHPSTESLILASSQSTELCRRSQVNEYCNNSNVYVLDNDDEASCLVPVSSGRRRVRELSFDELRKESTEIAPKSPMYLGLSFIACATAATAAGLLVRR